MEQQAHPDPRAAERELVERMLAGDPQAMEEFADGYFPPLYRFALSRLRGDRELAREIVHTTVVKALSKLAGFRGEALLSTWLCTCCRNEIGMYLRKRRRWPRLVELDERTGEAAAPEHPAPSASSSPEADLASKQTGELVHNALDQLPPHYAQALEWKYIDRLSVADIGRRLGTGAKAAESLLSRARRAFRTTFESSSDAARVPGEMISEGGGLPR